MNEIKIYHKDWIDTIYIDNDILYKFKDNDKGKFFLNDNILMIIWDKWDTEYFYSINNTDYYLIDNNFNISYICLVEDFVTEEYIIDIHLKKIYSKKNLNLFGSFSIENNKLVTLLDNNKKEFIYFNFKYYEINYLSNIFEIIYVDNDTYLLNKEDNICYKNYNILKKGYYFKHKNKISITIDNSTSITIDNSNSNSTSIYYLNEKNIYNLYTNVKSDIDINDFINLKNIIYIINERELDKIISYIDYFNIFNIKCIIFDNINNKSKNIIYDDLNIIYINNNLDNIINKYNIKKVYSYNSLNNEAIDDLINDNILINRWYILNKDNLSKYNYFLDSNNLKIPKVLHFIWIGNLKIPDEYINYIESWIHKHPDYVFCFWNDLNIPKLINQKYYDEAKTFAMKADILRYELLYFFGGIYIDSDFLCIKNIDEIIDNYIGFTGNESNDYIAIGLLGFIKHDKILLNIIKRIGINIDENINNKLNKTIPQLTGPVFFTDIWNKYKTENHFSFPPNYFYSYTFKDKLENKKYIINDDNYAIHMWGYSWNQNNSSKNSKDSSDNNYILYLYLSNIIININEKILDKLNYNDIILYLKNNILFKINNKKLKTKVVHVMGLFFTGGIERYLYYLDKYGNHDMYEYYLLYIESKSYAYDIKNIRMISFDWNHDYLNNLLINISPNLIIDHYSLYLDDNTNIYRGINKNSILYFVHSAINYNRDITKLSINKAIHLYKESNMDISWSNIFNNYYLTLGTELNLLEKDNFVKNEISKNNKNKINISIIGRIVEEKIPILFFEKLCTLSNGLPYTLIHIYGEKNTIFNLDYNEKFDYLINKSKIILHDFVDPLHVNNVYLNTDLLLIPSVYETGSFTCIEAFSYGIPVIARNVYGLKSLIRNNITGYLCETDEDILNKIKNIHHDKILKNNAIIKNQALNYNIIDKIKDFEIIINQNISDRNIFIVTSVLNCSDKPLSYYHTRNIFTLKERYLHTIKSIESIKKNITNVEILFCECSDLKDNLEIENNIRNSVDYYFNFNDNITVKNAIESEFKGLGEAHLLLEGIEKIINLKRRYKNIFKLSGRYFLNNDFNINIFDNNNKNIFTYWDNSIISYCTIFYKISMNDIDNFKYALLNSLDDLNNNKSIEQCMYDKFKNNILIIDKLNINGFLATEGYLVSI